MLNALPRKTLRVFGDGPVTSLKGMFLRARKRLTMKLQNPRLRKISFQIFCHWKVTMVNHQTEDPLYVMQFLGHKKLDTTLLYIQIEHALYDGTSDDFTAKVARTPEEIRKLLEAGFAYVCQREDLAFFRKRK